MAWKFLFDKKTNGLEAGGSRGVKPEHNMLHT